MPERPATGPSRLAIAIFALAAIVVHLVLRYALHLDHRVLGARTWDIPLLLALGIGGSVLLVDLVRDLMHGEFSSDLLAGISIVTAVLLGEYLAGTLVVLMLSGGEALEALRGWPRLVRARRAGPAHAVRSPIARSAPRHRRRARRTSRSATCSSSFRTRSARSTAS